MSFGATLIVSRGERSAHRETRRYEVPYTLGQSVLDGLRTVRATLDPSLSLRHSCINAYTCKECMILIDGKVDYACTTRLAPREMILEPLPNKLWLRDRVTEIAPLKSVSTMRSLG